MGLLSNTATFVRYAVEGQPPENFWEFVAEKIKLHSFKDIDDNLEERSVGWVSIHNMFDSEFAYASYAVGDYIVLAMRIDERKVPSAVLKKFCFKTEEQVKREKQIPRLTKSHKTEIRESVRANLIGKAVPTPSVYDLCWNLSENTLLFFSTNIKAQETLESLFKETFGLAIVLQIPYLTAAHLLPEDKAEPLDSLAPAIFI